jgi:predicted AAA+ superfamily ATPase
MVISLGDPLGESVFLQAFGKKSSVLKILDFLMDNLGSDYSKTEIAKGCDLSRGTLFSVWPRLEALELVVLTREVGRAKMYKLNKKNPVAGKLIELDNAISDFYATKLINCDIGIEENVSEPYLSSAEEQLSSRKGPILGGSAKVLI